MYRVILSIFILIAVTVRSDDEDENKYMIVETESGKVAGEKYWDGEFYEFFGVPYAKAPTGKDKYKAPLPVEPWEGVIAANVKNVICQQSFYTGEDSNDLFLAGEEDCLLMNLLVPEIASQENLVPVIVYIHSGAYSAGSVNMARYHYLARHDVIVVSFNFRLGAIGFACLGTEEIPGNAGLKDQVAALKWINKNIKNFGGDPKKVTLAGFSVGATLAELLALSKQTHGLIDKLVLESGSALAPFAINRDPISTAKNIAIAVGYNGTGDVKSLTEFYLNKAPTDMLAYKSINFFLPNSTFGFAPCIEDNHGFEPFLTESPHDIMERGDFPKLSVLTGFANMEGISRALKFESWSKEMNKNFGDFLPADLSFKDEKTKAEVIKSIKEFYFKNKEIALDNIIDYVDYFSDSMFKYNILKSAKIHAKHSKRPVYFYEFEYVGGLNMKHHHMDVLKGASHRDQSAYILDFLASTYDHKDFDVRDRMTTMWTDFIKYENPTAYESPVIDNKWPKFTNEEQIYLQINLKTEIKEMPLTKGYDFWDKLHQKYFWNPTKVKFSK